MRVLVRPSRAKRAAATVLLSLALGACSSVFGARTPPTYDLTAPHKVRSGGMARGQLIVVEPTALAVLDTEKIVVRPAAGEVAHLANAQWSDRLPKLLQARIVQSFENASRLRAVGRPGDRLHADFQLVTDVRAFQLVVGSGVTAEVEISAKVVADRAGRIVAAKVFRASVPTASTEAPGGALAIDEAFRRVVTDMIAWAQRLV